MKITNKKELDFKVKKVKYSEGKKNYTVVMTQNFGLIKDDDDKEDDFKMMKDYEFQRLKAEVNKDSI